MHKTVLFCLVFFFSANTFAQQTNETYYISVIDSIVKELDSENPPLLILKLGRNEVLIDKEDIYEIGIYKIKRIAVFERAIQLKFHYAKNGAYIIYPKRECKKELKKKYLRTEPNT